VITKQIRVPGIVPNSFKEYEKTVDQDGNTIRLKDGRRIRKTVILPDGKKGKEN